MRFIDAVGKWGELINSSSASKDEGKPRRLYENIILSYEYSFNCNTALYDAQWQKKDLCSQPQIVWTL